MVCVLRQNLNTRSFLLALLLGTLSPYAACTTNLVQSLTFRSHVTPPATRIPEDLRQHERMLRAGLPLLPERAILIGALPVAAEDMGLSQKQGTELAELLSVTYGEMAKDPGVAALPSALPFCLSTTKPDSGHYFLVRPKSLNPESPCIVFLHGYGGNFQCYTWALRQEFPKAVILVPSWGMSWVGGSPVYIQTMIADAEKRLGQKIQTPWLIGLSAGGRAGFRLYNHSPEKYLGFVCLANAPETVVARNLHPNLRVLMLNGNEDRMVPIAVARHQAAIARKRVPRLQFKSIDGDHFFLLSKREETGRILRTFMKQGESVDTR